MKLLNIKEWSKRKKLITSMTALGFLLIMGAAIALLLLRAPLTGSGQIVASPGLRYVSAVVDSQTNVNCSISVASDGSSANLQLDGIVTGSASRCRVSFVVQRQNTSEALVFQNVKFSSVVAETFVNACGVALNTGPTGIMVDFETGASAQPQSFTADEPNSGISVVSAADYVAANCTAA